MTIFWSSFDCWSNSINTTYSIKCYVCTGWWLFVYFVHKCAWCLTIFYSYCASWITSRKINSSIRSCCISSLWVISITPPPTFIIVCYVWTLLWFIVYLVCTYWLFIVYFVHECAWCLTILRIYCAWWNTSININSTGFWWVISISPTPCCMFVVFTISEGSFFNFLAPITQYRLQKTRSNTQCTITLYLHTLRLVLLSLLCYAE